MRADVRAPAISVLLQQECDAIPPYTQLYRQLREHILRETLAPGVALPSARTLASDLRLSRNTIGSAINQLRPRDMSRYFAALLRRAGRFYRQRRDLLVECLRDVGLTSGPNETGIHLTVHLPPTTDDVAISAMTAGHGLAISPLSRDYLGPTTERGLLLSFGAASESEIRRGVTAIVESL